MKIRYSRFFILVTIATIPFTIAGLFVYQNSFSGPLKHPGRFLFLASSVIPAIASIALAIAVPNLPKSILRSPGEKSEELRIKIILGVAFILALWAAIAATEALLRIFYVGIWGAAISDFPLISASSMFIGVLASIILLVLSFRDVSEYEAI
jgi:hypothetical protein